MSKELIADCLNWLRRRTADPYELKSADIIEEQQSRIAELERQVEDLEWENKGIDEWRQVAMEWRQAAKEHRDARDHWFNKGLQTAQTLDRMSKLRSDLADVIAYIVGYIGEREDWKGRLPLMKDIEQKLERVLSEADEGPGEEDGPWAKGWERRAGLR